MFNGSPVVKGSKECNPCSFEDITKGKRPEGWKVKRLQKRREIERDVP